ncbi:acetyl-CoA carboxylase [Leifsonia sp. McL0607]|uniref:acetyl-CoA carboxylase n=1 Tax=Leifsonia sp. McL0607 TaxID=3415672 RepID=UPI003CF9C1E2
MADIVSPLPGIFYRKPAPDRDPFVREGDRIDIGQTIGIVEIMKQFTEVQSTATGVIETFRVDDFGAVNPGDVIVTVREDR